MGCGKSFRSARKNTTKKITSKAPINVLFTRNIHVKGLYRVPEVGASQEYSLSCEDYRKTEFFMQKQLDSQYKSK